MELLEGALGPLPVEADLGDLLLHPPGALQRRQPRIDPLDHRAAGLLGLLDALPVRHHLVGVGRGGVAEDVRVPPDELFVDGAHDVPDGELAGLLGDPRLEDHLQQQVAEFLADLALVALLDRADDLVGLLDDVGLERLGGLLAVPRAAVGRAQPRHQLDEGREPVIGAVLFS